jgi:hypothetical protein
VKVVSKNYRSNPYTMVKLGKGDDISEMTRHFPAPRLGSLADMKERIRYDRIAPQNGHGPQESLQTKVQTNHAARHDTGHHKLVLSE